MPSTTTTVSMSFRGRSVLSLHRNQVVSMDQVHEDELHGLDLFQSHVADCLVSVDMQEGQLHSLPFLRRLLDAFLSCEDKFKSLIVQNPALVPKPPVDRLLVDLLDRMVKSLDVCNEITQSLQFLRHWNRHADIAASALPAAGSVLGKGQLIRARRALAKLLASSADHGNTNQNEAAICSSRKIERAWTFLSRTSANTKEEGWSSRSPSQTCSLGKQLQAMSANLVPPKGLDAVGGLALAVYTMSSVLVLSMWALVAAFSGNTNSSSVMLPLVAPPRQLAWAPSMIGLQERIGDEWRRRGRTKGGVLAELVNVERCGRELMEAVTVCEAGGKGDGVAGHGEELGEVSRRLEEGLGPFERQLRDVFHRIVRSREEVMRCLEESTKSTPPFIVL